MKNYKKFALLFVFSMAIILAACTSTPAAVSPTQAPAQTQVENPTALPTQAEVVTSEPTAEAVPTQPQEPVVEASGATTQEDAQGAVTVTITPLNLGQPGETLEFEVGMDTHSVDLSMDLTQLASLTTDSGKTVQPLAWDGGMGGHHVFGTLSFPASVDGSPLLDGANSLTLTVRNVDAPERTFTWQLAAE